MGPPWKGAEASTSLKQEEINREVKRNVEEVMQGKVKDLFDKELC